MKPIDPTVKRETLYITVWVAVLSVLMQAVFLVIRQWDLTVLWGNLLGGGAACLNFLLLGLTVQKAVEKEDEKEAKGLIRMSQMYRLFAQLIVVVIGYAAPIFHLWSVVIPLLFPRIAIALRPLFKTS